MQGLLEVLLLGVQPLRPHRRETLQPREGAGVEELAELGLRSQGYALSVLGDFEMMGLRPNAEVLALVLLGQFCEEVYGGGCTVGELLLGEEGVPDEEGEQFVHSLIIMDDRADPDNGEGIVLVDTEG